MPANKRTAEKGRPSTSAVSAGGAPLAAPAEADRLDEGTLGFERIVFFSDAVFAIAITLLALEIRLGEIPDALVDTQFVQKLWELGPEVFSFFLGFSVIGAYWISHHRIFGYIKRYDPQLIWLNLLFLALIAISPFPTSVIGEYGNHQPAQIFYALCVSIAGLAKALMWWYACHNHRLISEDLDKKVIRQITLRGLVFPILFLVSIPFTWFGPVIPIIIWALTPAVSSLVARLTA